MVLLGSRYWHTRPQRISLVNVDAKLKRTGRIRFSVRFFFTLFVFPLFVTSLALASSEWLRAPVPDNNVAGVTLVIHGLNTKPDKMHALAFELNSMKQDVLLVKLTGHQNDLPEFKNVTRSQFLLNVEESVKRAGVEARVKGRPLNLLAYSLGALLAMELVADGRAKFDRMILLAPALAIHSRSYLIKIFSIFGNSYLVPSMSPEDYRANPGTSIAAYRAVFESLAALKIVQTPQWQKANVPSLVFLDPDDELVSRSGVSEFILGNALSEWHLKFITASGSTVQPKYHHLIIDEPTLGLEPWRSMIQDVRLHLAP